MNRASSSEGPDRSSPFRRLPLALVLLGCVLLAACAPQQPATRPLYSGSDGIKLSFPEQNAVRQFQNDRFTVSVRLENDGTAAVPATNPGFVIASFDPAVLNLTSTMLSSVAGDRPLLEKATEDAGCKPAPGVQPSATCIAFAARGRTQFVPIGDILFAEFSFQAKPLTDSRQRATTPLTIQACYPYTTTFIANICVDSDFRNAPSASCNAMTVQAQPQGAPIAVSSVTPRYSRSGGGVSARYEITFRNLRDGLIIAPGPKSIDACNLDAISRAEYGVMRVAANLSTIPLNCGFEPGGVVRFYRGEATVICTYEGTSLPAVRGEVANYEAPLFVTAQYYYIQRLSTQIEVIR